jgi:hypothetical protein
VGFEPTIAVLERAKTVESELQKVTKQGRKKLEKAELCLLSSLGTCKITLLDYKRCEEIRQVLGSQPEDV